MTKKEALEKARSTRFAHSRHAVGESAGTRIFPCGKPRNKGTSNSPWWAEVTCPGCLAERPGQAQGSHATKATASRDRASILKQERQREHLLHPQKLGTAAAAKARAERAAKAHIDLVAAYPTEAERVAPRPIAESPMVVNLVAEGAAVRIEGTLEQVTKVLAFLARRPS